MEAQLQATNRLIAIMENAAIIAQDKTRQNASAQPLDQTVIDTQPQLARALTWLAAYPDMAGLSWRKAAAQAGVSVDTLRRAASRVKAQSRTVQERLL